MIATRFRTVGWTGCVCAAALAFYLVSQTVATKRAELAGVDRKIAATQREIRQLETEIGTRGGMAQIENWNSKVYGLQAPGAEQFVSSSVQLVAMVDPQPLPLDPAIVRPHGPVQQASLTMPQPAPAIEKPTPPAADPMPAVEQPMVRQATYVRPSRQAMAPDNALDNANVRKVSQTRLADAGLDDPKPVLARTPAAKLPAAKAVIAKIAEAQPAATKPVAAKPPAAKTAAKLAEKKPAKAPTKLTALDDAWLADVTAEPSGHRTRKGRP